FTGKAPVPDVLEPLPPALVRATDAVKIGEDSEAYSAALEDLLGVVMDMAHDAGGIIRLHAGADQPPPCRAKVYDYLWVGESVTNLDSLRRATSRLESYVVPCLDLAVTALEREDDLYLHAIPYLQ